MLHASARVMRLRRGAAVQLPKAGVEILRKVAKLFLEQGTNANGTY